MVARPPALPRSRAAMSGGASKAMRSRAVSSSAKGSAPGCIRTMNQRAEPLTYPWRSMGITPACTTLDLPLPLGPTTARKRPVRLASCSRLSNRAIRASRPKNSLASAS